MSTDSSETVLITGASAGIGYELAKLFARDGCRLVLNARDPERLAQAAKSIESESGRPILSIPADLSDPDAPEEIFQVLKGKGIAVDVLVNNAGYGMYGPFEKMDSARELGMIQLNMTALTHLTKLFLPEMLRKGKGGILNVASTAAFQPGPLMAVYYASKAYVYSFTRALRQELKGRGITVSVLCPGPTESRFWETAGIKKRLKLFYATTMTASEAARAGYRGFRKGKAIIIPGLMNKMLALGRRFLPEDFVIGTVHFLQKSKGGG